MANILQGMFGKLGLGQGNISGDLGGVGINGPAAPLGQAIGEKEIGEAIATLTKYRQGKQNLERRLVEDEEWYKLRYWEALRQNKCQGLGQPIHPEPTSAWMFNVLANKHADYADNYPEPNVLPRELSDEGSAKALSSILPVVLDRAEYEGTYSKANWRKLKHGTAATGVFWNQSLENGLGDIDIKPVDLLKLFWEPGIEDIQDSRNLFSVELHDKDVLEEHYPQLKGKLGGNVIDIREYIYDDQVDNTGKALVVDWYYKRHAEGGATVLHLAKFCNSQLLFASENDPAAYPNGYYAHGMYPFVFDVLFPEEGTPTGFGYVALTKSPQIYIDRLAGNILEKSDDDTRNRYFMSDATGVNEQEFLDKKKRIVRVQGTLDETRIKPIINSQLDPIYVSIWQLKVDELKETSGNRDVNSGSTGSGVTAAAAIAALQEAGNKGSRDQIAASYRAYVQVCNLCIELIRQFYDEARSFRILGPNGSDYEYIPYSNADIKDQPLPALYPDQQQMFRRPVFDIKVRAAKRNPFSRMSQNELAKELYGLGFFNPERAQEALAALELMDFEGKDKVSEYVRQGQTLLNICQQMAQRMDQMAALLQATTGMDMGMGAAMAGGQPPMGQSGGNPGRAGRNTLAGAAGQAERATMTPYGDRLAARSKPNMAKANGPEVRQ